MKFVSTVALFLLLPLGVSAQLDPLSKKAQKAGSPVTQPTLSPGTMELLELDNKFSDETVKGGGRVFASWFADDALTLNNGKQPTYGKANIAASATWGPSDYELKWQPLGAQMGPSGDMGFTWGHYDGRGKDKNGGEVVLSGRYITVWKKVNGQWKVALDASANEPPDAGECCRLPKP
jgi:ketosteroid isomerase-like protein